MNCIGTRPPYAIALWDSGCVQPLPLTRAQLLERTGNHPYAAMMTSGETQTIYARCSSYVWLAEGPWGPVTVCLGESAEVLPVLADLRPTWSRVIHLPRSTPEQIAAHLTPSFCEDWDFLWTTQAPPLLADESRVEPLTDNDTPDIEAVLEDALPDSSTRPGDPRIHAWFGIRSHSRLIAVAADRSRGDTGFLAGIAVRRDHQGQGLGAALTSALTRSLLDGYAAVALGVATENMPAQRLYARLGYTGRIERTSIRLS
jgi:GNAT superfamily N-acetyltransferase